MRLRNCVHSLTQSGLLLLTDNPGPPLNIPFRDHAFRELQQHQLDLAMARRLLDAQ